MAKNIETLQSLIRKKGLIYINELIKNGNDIESMQVLVNLLKNEEWFAKASDEDITLLKNILLNKDTAH